MTHVEELAQLRREVAVLRKMLVAIRANKGRTVCLIEFTAASEAEGGCKLIVTHPSQLMEEVFVREIGGLVCDTLKALAAADRVTSGDVSNPKPEEKTMAPEDNPADQISEAEYLTGLDAARRRQLRCVYVASSWRNAIQPAVVAALRAAGLDVYDFRNPAPGDTGFSWREIDPNWMSWTPAQWREALKHPVAQKGFALDKSGMDRADCCVLVLPCGRSAHLEAGYMAAQGKTVFTLATQAIEPDLMNLLLGPADNLCVSMEELLDRLGRGK